MLIYSIEPYNPNKEETSMLLEPTEKRYLIKVTLISLMILTAVFYPVITIFLTTGERHFWLDTLFSSISFVVYLLLYYLTINTLVSFIKITPNQLNFRELKWWEKIIVLMKKNEDDCNYCPRCKTVNTSIKTENSPIPPTVSGDERRYYDGPACRITYCSKCNFVIKYQ